MTVTIGIASLLAVPAYQAISEKATVAEAVTLAGDLQRKLARAYAVTGSFPTSNRHAAAMISSRFSKPDFVRDLQIQPDRTGQTVAIRVFLRDGAVKNRSGEKQYIYIVGNGSASVQRPIEWHCGAAGLSLELLPDDCQG